MIDSPTIFTGGDSKYWKKYGKVFVRSFNHYNPDKTIHVHIINPDDNDIEDLKLLPCNYTTDFIDEIYINDLCLESIKYLENPHIDELHKQKLKHGLSFCNEETLVEKMKHLMTFSVYACNRFITLSKLWTGNHPVAAYDMDTICKGTIDINKMLGTNDCGCLSVKGNRFVVSLVAFRNKNTLLTDWGNSLTNSFTSKKVYGFLDQDTFVEKSKLYNTTHIDKIFCDHTKKSDSALVMTGKGAAKISDRFYIESKKWL